MYPISKGNEVNIPQAIRGVYGNISKLRDVSVNSWKSYLFFLTNYDLEIGLSRAKVVY
jgi:hypothetical protein